MVTGFMTALFIMQYMGTYIKRAVTMPDEHAYECADMLICQSMTNASYLDQA